MDIVANGNLRKLAFLFSAASAVMCEPALAQGEIGANDDSEGLETIVVTARKVEENIQDVPISITAYSGEELIQRNATEVIDIQRGTPSLYMRSTSASPSTLSISLRGQFQGSYTLNTDPSVATYVDGVYIARTFGLNGDLLDINNVQVLKGPQGTLFGRNTNGGAIVFETNNPSLTEATGNVMLRYGRFDERAGSIVVNLPVMEDKIGLRMAGQFTRRDGWAKDVVTGIRSKDIDNSTIRGKLRFKPTENLDLVISGEHFRSDSRGVANQLNYLAPNLLMPPAPSADVIAAGAEAAARLAQLGEPVPPGLDPFAYPPFVSAFGAFFVSPATFGTDISSALDVIDYLADHPSATWVDTTADSRSRATTANFIATWDTSVAQIKLITGYRKVFDKGTSDGDGSPFPILTFAGGAGLNQKQWSTELQATGKAFDDALDFAAGVYFFNEKGDVESSTTGNVFRDNDNFGIYGQGTWHISDEFSITGGLRYSEDTKRTTQRLTGNEFSRRDKFDGVSFLASAEYQPTPNHLLYAKVSRSFRSGGQNDFPTQPVFKPEKATSYEIGQKSEFFGNRVRTNIAAYYTESKDMQRLLFSGFPPVALILTAGKFEVWGVEADLAFKLPFGLLLGATGAITEPKYKRYEELPSASNLDGDRRRERFDSVPTRQFSLSAAYEHSFGSTDLAIRADYAWNNAYPLMPTVAFLGDPIAVTIDPNTGKTIEQSIIDATTSRDVGIVNARASLAFDDGRYEIALFGRNLTNERDPVSGLSAPVLYFTSIQRRAPRTFGIELRANIGGN